MKERNEIMRFFGLHPQNDVRRKGATHVDNSNNKRRFAFTLAEVLITLGIIGVVAALTIPNLIQEYQKKQWVAGLQRGYATLNQVFKTAMAEDMVDDVTQTELYNAIPIDDGGFRIIRLGSSDYSQFVEQLKKYLKITKVCNPTDSPLEDSCYGITYSRLTDGHQLDLDSNELYWPLNKGWHLKVYTTDGLVYYFNDLSDNNLSDFGGYLTGSIEIDVNGDTGPNQLGRDLFSFVLLKNGNVIMPGTKSWDDEAEGLYHWSNEDSHSGCLLISNEDTYYNGDYCGARIFENGWKMDY